MSHGCQRSDELLAISSSDPEYVQRQAVVQFFIVKEIEV